MKKHAIGDHWYLLLVAGPSFKLKLIYQFYDHSGKFSAQALRTFFIGAFLMFICSLHENFLSYIWRLLPEVVSIRNGWVNIAMRTTSGNIPDSKVHGANMGPIWGRQDPGGPHVGPMNFAICDALFHSNILTPVITIFVIKCNCHWNPRPFLCIMKFYLRFATFWCALFWWWLYHIMTPCNGNAFRVTDLF